MGSGCVSVIQPFFLEVQSFKQMNYFLRFFYVIEGMGKEISIIVIIPLLFISFEGCNKLNKRAQIHNDLYGKKIKITDSILPFNQVAKDYNFLKKRQSNLILVVFDCNCPTCAFDLVEWEEMIKTKKLNAKEDLALIFSKNIHFYVKKILKNKNIISFPVFIDPNMKFLEHNNLISKNNYDALVLDDDNKIKFIGTQFEINSHLKSKKGI